jgi:hypothetical protein
VYTVNTSAKTIPIKWAAPEALEHMAYVCIFIFTMLLVEPSCDLSGAVFTSPPPVWHYSVLTR